MDISALFKSVDLQHGGQDGRTERLSRVESTGFQHVRARRLADDMFKVL
jgi:hypothetical protein